MLCCYVTRRLQPASQSNSFQDLGLGPPCHTQRVLMEARTRTSTQKLFPLARRGYKGRKGPPTLAPKGPQSHKEPHKRAREGRNASPREPHDAATSPKGTPESPCVTRKDPQRHPRGAPEPTKRSSKTAAGSRRTGAVSPASCPRSGHD